tara:strand:- start:92 stop:271 length:180 start_codon:yes stop_codon:yes gene_type:complete
MEPIKNDYQAFVTALVLAVQAPTTEKSDRCLVIAEEIACKLNPDQVEKGQSEANSILLT